MKVFLLLYKISLRKNTSEYVFPSVGKQGHIIEPRKQTAKVKADSGVMFTIHDLQRTFITIAESLAALNSPRSAW